MRSGGGDGFTGAGAGVARDTLFGRAARFGFGAAADAFDFAAAADAFDFAARFGAALADAFEAGLTDFFAISSFARRFAIRAARFEGACADAVGVLDVDRFDAVFLAVFLAVAFLAVAWLTEARFAVDRLGVADFLVPAFRTGPFGVAFVLRVAFFAAAGLRAAGFFGAVFFAAFFFAAAFFGAVFFAAFFFATAFFTGFFFATTFFMTAAFFLAAALFAGFAAFFLRVPPDGVALAPAERDTFERLFEALPDVLPDVARFVVLDRLLCATRFPPSRCFAVRRGAPPSEWPDILP